MTRGQVRLGAVLATTLVLAVGLWLALTGGNGPPSRAPARSKAAAEPRLSQGGLIERAQSSGVHVYWVGPRAGSGYELTTTPAGRAFVRYLPRGVDAGDPRPNFLTVGTYPLSSGVSALRRAGRTKGAQVIKLPRGALVYVNREKPTSAYLARPGWHYEVEVFHPTPGEAMRLVLVGDVRQITTP
jgi:hypothetical protein